MQEIDRVALLSKTALFGESTTEQLSELAVASKVVRLRAGELLFSAGDPSRGLFIVVSGRTRALRHNLEGREQIMHEDGPFASFPEVAVFDDGPYPSTVVAVEDTRLLFLPKEKIREFCLLHPAVALAALRLLAGRLRTTTGMVEDFALREVAQRLAEYLLETTSQMSRSRVAPIQFDLPHTNQEIADRIGSVREVVSRAFSKLQRNGWVEKSGRKILILDLEGLDRYVTGSE